MEEKPAAVKGRKEMFYLMMHSTHFIYGYMTSDIWLRTILIVRKETSGPLHIVTSGPLHIGTPGRLVLCT